MCPVSQIPNQTDLLAGVLDSSLNGIMAFRSIRDEQGQITDFLFLVVNRKGEQIVGRKAEDLLGRTLLQIYPGNKTDGLFDAYAQVVETGEPFTTEHYYAHDGFDHWFSISATKCGDGFTVTFADISARKAAEVELQKLSLIAMQTGDGVVLTDARGRVEWVNDAFVQLSGYSLDELLRKKPGHLLQGPETDQTTVARIREKLKRGEGFYETLLNYNKSGEIYWIESKVQPIHNSQGELTHYVAIERNVTEKRQQQQELEEHRRRLEFALEVSRSGHWDWHVATGENFLSDSWFTMLGYEPGELAMNVQTWLDIAEPGDLKKAKAALQAYFEGQAKRYVCEMRVKNKAGDWQWVLDVGEAVEWDDAGKVVRMVGLQVDIHEQKVAQFELAQARDAAQQANAAKSSFVANMSHEIRTPMNAILGYADLMLDADQNEADKRNHAQTIRRNGKHLLNILNDVLDISKIEAGKMSIERVSCSPDQLFADVITLMMPKAIEKGIDLAFEAVTPLPQRIQTDPTRVRQILLNLVGNAIKFTEAGSVRVVVRNKSTADGTIELQCDVIDTGLGMNPEKIAQLFKPFCQADESTTRKFGGTGLGLAISYNLCELLGGELTCISSPGEGSTFTARFDVGRVENNPSKNKPTRRQPIRQIDPLRDLRILIVEDGPDNQRLIKHYLTKAGAQVVLAENGAIGRDAALDALKQDRPFDMVLMDMQMPVLDGYDATRELRAAEYDLPIIALTAHASAADRASCLDAGCSDYLSKPVDRHKLIRTIAYSVDACVEQGAGV